MGVYQEWNGTLTIPKDQAASIRAELADACATWKDTTNEDDITAIMWFLSEGLGTEDHPQEAWYAPEDAGGSWKITGASYGKVHDDDAVLAVLAAHGATGEIDWECEGEHGRFRLIDGGLRQYGMVATYPMDPQSDDPLAKVITELVEDMDWSADTLNRIVGHLAELVDKDDYDNVKRKY